MNKELMELLRSENYEALGKKLTEAAPDELSAFFVGLDDEQFKRLAAVSTAVISLIF